jgi:preprotein translocase subunit YajC
MGNEILAASSSSSGGNFLLLPIFIALLAFMYFVMIRPQRNRQRAAMQTQRQLEPGTEVRTTAGIYGTIISVDGDDIMLEISPGVEIRILRRAIMDVVPGTGVDEAEEPGAEDESGEAAEEAGHGEADAAANEAGPSAVDDSETPGEASAASNGRGPAEKGQPAG